MESSTHNMIRGNIMLDTWKNVQALKNGSIHIQEVQATKSWSKPEASQYKCNVMTRFWRNSHFGSWMCMEQSQQYFIVSKF